MMETMHLNDAAKRLSDKRNRKNILPGIAGRVSLVLGVILFSFGLWTHFHGGKDLFAQPYGESAYAEASGNGSCAPSRAEILADARMDDGGLVSFTADDFSDFAFILLNNDDQKGDMTGLLGDVTIEDQKGETVTDGKLFVGEKYTIHLKFQEKGAQSGEEGQFHWTDDGKMTYKIPKNFKVSPRSGEKLTVTINGEEVEIGTFSIDEDGLLTVELSEAGRRKLENSTDIAVFFDMDATAQRLGGGSDEDVHFGDVGEAFKFVVTQQPRITVNKASAYDSNDQILNYTVSARVDHGPVHDVTVSDTLTPPQTKGVTLEMVTGEDDRPEIQVTVRRGEESFVLTEEDYELVPVAPDPTNPYAPQTFQVKLKEGSRYNPLNTGDELCVSYQYQAKFDQSAADIFFGNVVNEATVSGFLPMKDPATDTETRIPVEEKRGSNAQVYWDTNGEGVVSKAQHYSEATGKLHYTLYALAKAGEYTPFLINDRATVEYDGHTWIVQGFDAAHCQNLEVYAQDIADWDALVDEKGQLNPGAAAGDKEKLTGYEYQAYLNANGNPEGYSAESMDNYVYWLSDGGNPSATDLYIFFGIDQGHPQGHWKYQRDRLITVEYDLDVSDGLALYSDDTKETITLTKEEVLLTGITNKVTLQYGPYYPNFSVFFSNGEKLNKYGSLDKVHNTIDYTVSLNLQDSTVWDYLKDVAGDDPERNDGNAAGKILSAVFYDDYPDGWEYVDGSLKAVLYPKSGEPMEYVYVDWWQYQSWFEEQDDFSDGDIRAYLWDFIYIPWGRACQKLLRIPTRSNGWTSPTSSKPPMRGLRNTHTASMRPSFTMRQKSETM